MISCRGESESSDPKKNNPETINKGGSWEVDIEVAEAFDYGEHIGDGGSLEKQGSSKIPSSSTDETGSNEEDDTDSEIKDDIPESTENCGTEVFGENPQPATPAGDMFNVPEVGVNPILGSGAKASRDEKVLDVAHVLAKNAVMVSEGEEVET
ncbi:hypothetical protein U1Q18_003399 [Sarracenia purpurea var. burkii]